MASSFIADHCANCAVKFRSASQIFNKMTVVDEITSFKPQELKIIDAVLYIYGFSASNLAFAYFDDEVQENFSSFHKISEAREYISKRGISLCTNCVSVFKKLYIAYYGLKTLSDEASILMKAIKKFSPASIKMEDNAEEYKRLISIPEIVIEEETVRPVNPVASANKAVPVRARKTPPEYSHSSIPTTYAEESETDNLFETFNNGSDNDFYESEQDDVKPDLVSDTSDNYENDQDDLKPDTFSDNEFVSSAVNSYRCAEEKNRQQISRDKKLHSNRTTKLKLGSKNPKVKQNVRPEELSPKCSAAIVNDSSVTARASPADSSKSSSFTSTGAYLTRRTATLFNVEIPKLEPERPEIPKVKVKRIITEEEKDRKRLTNFIMLKTRKRGVRKRKNGWMNIALEIRKEWERKKQEAISDDRNAESVACDQMSENEGKPDKNENNKGSVERKSIKKPRILSCSCGKAFWSVSALRYHEKRHQQLEPVICDICGQSFERKYMLYKHKSRYHSELPEILFKCDLCEHKSDTHAQLKKHKKQVHSKKRVEKKSIILKCSCGEYFGSLLKLRVHEKSHESQEPLVCDICGESFAKNYQLYGHKSLEHSEMPQLVSKCDSCDAKFFSMQTLRVHIAQHHSNTKDKPFICDKCGTGYSCLHYLKKHQKRAHKDDGVDKEKFKCEQCGIFLKHSASLNKHMKTMHGTPKIFICPQCGKTTKNMTNMNIHMKVHDPNRIVKRKTPTEKLAKTIT